MHRQPTAKYWITRLALQPHPEGGYFREIYRAKDQISAAALPTRYQGPRAFSTSIYFLLTGTQTSTLHRLASDEQWHFYDGSTLLLAMIAPDGTSREVRLGRCAIAGEQFQAVIPAGTWMGARLAAPQHCGRTSQRGYALIGCTVAPGFEFQDFAAGRRSDLLERFPQHRKLITALTRAR
ncbi:MAG: cupin domain-containing protein [Verrucomicrobia bacterium]|nr:cupin domain-containing protein [Verrucomicrobiota bacterium]MBU1734759.1 cupin domain-containing protein [Verrucomicrobiota bacterium]MBU1857778.1 cupin domain-containing protein [Verrucomicrobiota bacterium]